MIKTTTTLFSLLLLALSNTFWSQWSATGIGTNTGNTIWDVESHNGILFASSNTDGFIKSIDNGVSWSPVNQNGFTTNPISVRVSSIVSAGSSLYVVTFNANYSSSMVYVSIDNGVNFSIDTVGIPKVSGNNECVNVDRIYHHNGQLVIDVANLGNWHKSVGGLNWNKNNHVQTQYSELFGFYNGRYFTHANYRTYYSDDNGQTWTQCADANLPNWFTATVFTSDTSTGNLYTAGRVITTQEYKFLYSTDAGASWDSIAINQYLGNNWLSQLQTIQSIYVKGNFIEISLDNNATSNSHPDVLASSDGGTSFMFDTLGLPTDVAYSYGRKFVEQNGSLFMALTAKDVYKKALATTSVNNLNTTNSNILIYPNPANENFYISSIEQGDKISILDITGKLIEQNKAYNNNMMLNVSSYKNGTYIVAVEKENTIKNYKLIIQH